MRDFATTPERSRTMSRIRSTGNKSTELRMIQLFRSTGIKGWRRHWPVTGRPDFAFPSVKIAVFVDGCFWHGHTCRIVVPKHNADYWKAKIQTNRKRDRRVVQLLRSKGWSVYRFWECSLKGMGELVAAKIKRRIDRANRQSLSMAPP